MSDVVEPEPSTSDLYRTEEQSEGANWTADAAFTEAKAGVDERFKHEELYHSLLVVDLIRTAGLIEHWRGPHRAEIDAYPKEQQARQCSRQGWHGAEAGRRNPGDCEVRLSSGA